MAFPATPLPQKHEILINGVWTDITTKVRGLGGRDGVTITRGYSGEQSQLSPGSVALSLNNRDNRFSNKNPTSPYYRQLGRNTQYRNAIDTTVVSARFLDMSTAGTSVYDGSTVWTADKASLDVVGDIDITVDVDAEDWRGRRGHILASKYVTSGNQRSWVFGINPDGYLYFFWSTDGNSPSSATIIRCAVPVWPTGRIALRVLLDVDNGSGGFSVGFFTAPTLLGNTTPLGSTQVFTAGITSIFSSSARVELGTANNGNDRPTFGTTQGDLDPFCGKMYGFRMRSGFGVGGIDVATMDATTQTAGTTSWSDGLASPNTWTVTGSTYLHSYDFRFWGELPSLPRLADVSVTDIYVNARAADIIQRLTQGNNAKPLRSAVFRNLSQYAWDGYWPCEDSATTGTGFAAYQGGPGYQTNGSFNGQPAGFLGSAGSITFNDDQGYASGNAAISSGTPTVSTVLCYFKFNPAPSTGTQLVFFNAYYAGGTAYRVTFSSNNTTFGLTINDVNGNSLVNTTSTFGTGVTPGAWVAMRIKMTASGGTITWEWAWYQINATTTWGTSGTFSGTLSRPSSWISWPFTGKSGFQLAHVALGRFDLQFVGADFLNSTNAYVGERWPDRARRLAAEQNIALYIQGISSQRDGTSVFLKEMGAQSIASFTTLMQQCADAAGGTLFAPRDKFGLTIRSWECLANQVAGSQPKLDYAQAALTGTLSPNPDDFLVENDVTLTQPDGQSFRYAKITGSLNTADPLSNADAVGTYDVTDSTSTYLAADLAAQVYRRVLFGTWDEERYSGITVNLERSLFVSSATLTAQIRKLDLGRAFSIINPGSNWLSYNQIDLLETGYVETLGQTQHQFVFNTRPAGPWNTGIWGSTAFATTSLWGPASTTLNAGINTVVTSIVVTTPDLYELWTYVSNYLIEIAGERMTVTACSARSGSGPYTYTLTVTRSVNGVVKSISAGEAVTLPAVGRWD